ncbi:MAG: hypothetical protein ACW98X_26645 [Promethearchaeota archaeon]|jgi:hypothetical protein
MNILKVFVVFWRYAMFEVVDLIDIEKINSIVMKAAVKLFSKVSIVSTPDKNSVSRVLDNNGRMIAIGWIGSNGTPKLCPVNLEILN